MLCLSEAAQGDQRVRPGDSGGERPEVILDESRLERVKRALADRVGQFQVTCGESVDAQVDLADAGERVIRAEYVGVAVPSRNRRFNSGQGDLPVACRSPPYSVEARARRGSGPRTCCGTW